MKGLNLCPRQHDCGGHETKRDTFSSAELVTQSQNVDQLENLIQHLLEGCVHSILATIDGASKSAETGRVQLVGPDGSSLGEGLHELFADYLGAP